MGADIQMALGLVYGIAALHKVRDPLAFADGIRRYNLVPQSATIGVAVVITCTELLVAYTHITGVYAMIGMVIGAALLVSFAAATAVVLARGGGNSLSLFRNVGVRLWSDAGPNSCPAKCGDSAPCQQRARPDVPRDSAW